jgi:adenosylhomocysteine nucleosidase
MSLVFVFMATKMEGAAAKRLMLHKTRVRATETITKGRIGENDVVLVITGMGPQNAKTAARRILQQRVQALSPDCLEGPAPDVALVSGLAGSLVPSTGGADIVVYQNCLSDQDSDRSISCPAQLVESVTRTLASNSLQSRKVTGVSSAGIVQHDEERRRLADTGASVVDMESFEIAECCASAGVPVAVLRAISDGPGARMPDLNRALGSNGRFDRWALASVLAASPLATVRLFRASRRAIAALEQALEAVLSSTSLSTNYTKTNAGRSGAQNRDDLKIVAGIPADVPAQQQL